MLPCLFWKANKSLKTETVERCSYDCNVHWQPVVIQRTIHPLLLEAAKTRIMSFYGRNISYFTRTKQQNFQAVFIDLTHCSTSMSYFSYTMHEKRLVQNMH
ncbi:hypothetical protein CHARACLAT_008920 [Characodon lateralis]|uniref:Uncharacterized protein n=1 Tax=Characodon lateralis TaxID=208331 RepID=A0ABU7D5N1_9TELE|nr:hypothetical protein [Characodon lateralis]